MSGARVRCVLLLLLALAYTSASPKARHRPHNCANGPTLYRICFRCARLTGHHVILDRCCSSDPIVYAFCYEVVAGGEHVASATRETSTSGATDVGRVVTTTGHAGGTNSRPVRTPPGAVLGVATGTTETMIPVTSAVSAATGSADMDTDADRDTTESNLAATTHQPTTVPTTPPTTVTTPTTPVTSPTTPRIRAGGLDLTTRPQNVTDVLGSQVFLECLANDVNAEIFWYHNDVLLTGSDVPAHVMIFRGLLLIEALTSGDTGHYVCEAETDDDVVSASAHVHVPRATCQVEFTHRPSDKRVSVGTRSVLFQCSSRNVRRIDWYKGHRLIRNEEGKYRKMTNGFLFIQNICLGDMGKYRCVAHKAGDTCNTELKVTLDVWHTCGQPVLAQPAERPPEETRGLIVGGTQVTPGSSPWMAQLFETNAGAFCGGTLIAKRWVLTATHCIAEFEENYGRPLTEQNLIVRLGKHNTVIEEEHQRIYAIARIIQFGGFVPSTYNNDITLLQLESDAEYSDYIKPICLVPEEFHQQHFLPGTLGTVTGWGSLGETGARPMNLQEIQLPMQNQTTCERSTRFAVTPNMFCAGFAQGIIGDACEGDSGGPFVMKHERVWYHVGVVSWGEGCGQLGKYGFYTKVAKYYHWIMTTIGNNCV